MNTKNNQRINTILYSLLVLAILVPMLGCKADDKTVINRPAPANDTLTEEKPKKEAEAPVDPSAAFAGVWETKDPRAKSSATTEYVRWKIGPAIQKDGQSVGKITDVSDNNKDVANYVLGPKNTITLEYFPALAGNSRTYDYEVSDNGDTITLKGDSPIILKRGSNNSDILKDAETIATNGPWRVDRDLGIKLFGSTDVAVIFATPSKYKEGYGGTMEINDLATGQPPRVWNYTITAKDKVEIKDGNGTKEASYKILNDGKILQIDYVDDTPDLYLTQY